MTIKLKPQTLSHQSCTYLSTIKPLLRCHHQTCGYAWSRMCWTPMSWICLTQGWTSTHSMVLSWVFKGLWEGSTAVTSAGHTDPVKQPLQRPAVPLCLTSTLQYTAVFHAFSAQLCKKNSIMFWYRRFWTLLPHPLPGYRHRLTHTHVKLPEYFS